MRCRGGAEGAVSCQQGHVTKPPPLVLGAPYLAAEKVSQGRRSKGGTENLG